MTFASFNAWCSCAANRWQAPEHDHQSENFLPLCTLEYHNLMHKLHLMENFFLILLDRETLEQVTCFEYLGVNVTRDGSSTGIEHDSLTKLEAAMEGKG